MRRVAIALAIVIVALGAGVACSGDGGSASRGGGSASSGADGDEVEEQPADGVDGPEDLPLPDTRGEAAATLERVELALRAPTTPPAKRARLGWEQQNAYRALGVHDEWVDEVLDALPADVRPIVAANERAARGLAALARDDKPPEDLPKWVIVPPEPLDVLRSYYDEAEAASDIPWAYFASIHLVETRLGRIRGTSSAGAQGPMQFLPATWERYGDGDVNDNRDAILAAARLLLANGAPGDMSRALYRYNNSMLYVDAVQSYARLMLADERAFLGYYHWQVYYATVSGTFLLPEGFPTTPAREISPARRDR